MNNTGFKLDFLGIGVPRSGTTWLAKCLAAHPQICFSSKKEINFFNKKLYWVTDWEWQYPKGMDWYRDFFSHYRERQIRGEFSPAYFYDETVPELIKGHFPDIKFILILRNPIEVFYSHYHFSKHEYGFPPLEEMLNNEDYIAYGFYSKNLTNYFRHFPREVFHIKTFDELRADPKNFLKEVYDFLGVDGNFVPEIAEKKDNPTGRNNTFLAAWYYNFHHKIRNKFKSTMSENPKLKNILVSADLFVRDRIRNLRPNKSYYPPMPMHVRNRLKGIYAEEIGRLDGLLGRDLKHWLD